jgi:hypothetical protein
LKGLETFLGAISPQAAYDLLKVAVTMPF